MARTKDEKLDFESALNELDSIVERMEEGELTLESSLKEFERGIMLTRQCKKQLEQAEQKVQILIKENGTETLKGYEDKDDE